MNKSSSRPVCNRLYRFQFQDRPLLRSTSACAGHVFLFNRPSKRNFVEIRMKSRVITVLRTRRAGLGTHRSTDGRRSGQQRTRVWKAARLWRSGASEFAFFKPTRLGISSKTGRKWPKMATGRKVATFNNNSKTRHKSELTGSKKKEKISPMHCTYWSYF